MHKKKDVLQSALDKGERQDLYVEVLFTAFGLKGKAVLEKALGEAKSLGLTNSSMAGPLIFLVVCSEHCRSAKLM